MRICLCILLLLPSFCTFAQVPDSSVQKRLVRADSLLQRVSTKADSLQASLQGFRVPQLSADSLALLKKFDSTKRKWLQKLDSAKQQGLPTSSIQRKLDSLSQRSPYRYVDSIQQKLDKLQQRLSNNRLQKAEDRVNKKLNFIKAEAGEGAVLPNNIDLSSKLPSTALPSGSMPEVNLPELKMPEGNLGLPELKTDLPTSNITAPLTKDLNLPEVDQLKAATDKLNQVGELTDNVEEYKTEVTNLKENGLAKSKELPALAEKQIGKLDEMQQLQDQTKKMKLPIAGNMDEDAAKVMLKEQAQAEVMNLAKDHFAGHQQALMAGLKKLTDLKSTYESLDSINVPKRRPNTMKGKPLRVRLVPGFTFQLQKSAFSLLDLNPTLAYRITGHWSAGLGWNQRIGFTKNIESVKQERIYGPRVFVDFLWTKGFSLRLEGEQMYGADVTTLSAPKSANEQMVWLTTLNVGVKKEYKISKQLRGNAQVLYILFDDHHSSPYAIKINTRLGLEYHFKNR